jgi:hypothetical protein
MRSLILLLPALTLGGCVSTVKSVVTAPFKVVGQAADWATTSQDEADRNRGRAERKAEERARKACRKARDQGEYDACLRDEMRREGN